MFVTCPQLFLYKKNIFILKFNCGNFTVIEIRPFVGAFVCLSVCVSFCLSGCPSVYLSVGLPACLSDFVSACLSAFVSVCLSACLSVCLSAYPMHACINTFCLNLASFQSTKQLCIHFYKTPPSLKCLILIFFALNILVKKQI